MHAHPTRKPSIVAPLNCSIHTTYDVCAIALGDSWLVVLRKLRNRNSGILAVRFVAVILSNATGYPCGREGPTASWAATGVHVLHAPELELFCSFA